MDILFAYKTSAKRTASKKCHNVKSVDRRWPGTIWVAKAKTAQVKATWT